MSTIFENLNRVDEIIQAGPSKALCSELLEISNTEEEAYNYIFNNLKDEAWFDYLKHQNVFLPENIKNINTLSRYLVSIASQRPDEIMVIIESLVEADKIDFPKFTESVMKMPPTQMQRWVEVLEPKVSAGWFDGDFFLLNPVKDFLLVLVSSNLKSVFPLFSSVIDVLPIDEGRHHGFNTRIEKIWYDETLKTLVLPLCKLDSKTTANILSDKVDLIIQNDAVRIDSDSGCAFWLPAVEDHSQNTDYLLEVIIFVSLRKVLEFSCEEEDCLIYWLEWLRAKDHPVYKRLSIHLIRLFGDDKAVCNYLLSQEYFNKPVYVHEYLLLLKNGFSRLQEARQEELLCIIDAISIETYDNVSPEECEKYVNYQKARYLAFIESDLEGKWRQRFSELKPLLGEIDLDRLSFDSWSSGARFIETKPSITVEELGGMSVSDFVDHLVDCVDIANSAGFSKHSLGETIASAVSMSPRKYIESMDVLKNSNIYPEYIWRITAGFISEEAQNVVNEFALLDWLIWCMGLGEWRYPAKASRPQPGDHNDNKRSILHYLIKRLEDRAETLIAEDYRKQVLQIIQVAMTSEDPSGESFNNYFTQAINCVRGIALDFAVKYGASVLKQSRKNDPKTGLDSQPILKGILEDRLVDSNEPSLAVRSVFGHNIPNLYLMDKEWLKAHIGGIFPGNIDRRLIFDAAWDAYLIYSRCYKDLFETLQPVYERAVHDPRIRQIDQGSSGSDSVLRLSSHLVLLYAWGKIDLSEDSILCVFMKEADSVYQAEIVRHMGRVLDENPDLPRDVTERFATFHQWLSTELALDKSIIWEPFAIWFLSSYYEPSWKIEQLVRASQFTSFGHRDSDVLKRLLEDYIDAYPNQVLSVVESYVTRRLSDQQTYYISRVEPLPEILLKGHNHADPKVKEHADAILGKLVSSGFLKFRDVYEGQLPD